MTDGVLNRRQLDEFNDELTSLLMKYKSALCPQEVDAFQQPCEHMGSCECVVPDSVAVTEFALIVNWYDMERDVSFISGSTPLHMRNSHTLGLLQMYIHRQLI